MVLHYNLSSWLIPQSYGPVLRGRHTDQRMQTSTHEMLLLLLLLAVLVLLLLLLRSQAWLPISHQYRNVDPFRRVSNLMRKAGRTLLYLRPLRFVAMVLEPDFHLRWR